MGRHWRLWLNACPNFHYGTWMELHDDGSVWRVEFYPGREESICVRPAGGK